MLWLAGLFFLAIRKLALKWRNQKIWWLPVTLLALAVCSLAYAPLPFGWGTAAELGATIVSWALNWIGGLIDASGQVIAGLLLVLVLIFGVHDLVKDRTPDKWAKTMVYSLPVLALVAAGPVAAQVQTTTQLISSWGPSVISALTG